jgi:plasmid stabilization system protein ParE
MAFTFVACDDLKRICESIATSVDRWGGTVAENQAAADDFARHFERHCALIAANPELGVARPELQREIRSSAFQRHVIFYRLRGGKLEVLRILPAAKDVAAIA